MWCSESKGEDCGIAGADYQEMKILKDDEKMYCNTLSIAVDHMTCNDLKIFDEIIHQVDDYRAFTIIRSNSIMTDGKIPNLPLIEAGTYRMVGTTTYVLIDNDIWVLSSSYSPPQNFDAELDQKILSTFKINNVYAQEDVFISNPTSWIDALINSIMSIFSWSDNESSTTQSMITEPVVEEYVPEQVRDSYSPPPMPRLSEPKYTSADPLDRSAGRKYSANCVLVGNITEKKDNQGNTIFTGEIKNIGGRRADFVKMDIEWHEADVLCATDAALWKRTDAVVEEGSAGNADRIHAHFESLPVNLFAQMTAWQRVEKRADMPESHRDGSLFISTKDAMPWF